MELAVPGFVQIVEFKTSRIDEVKALSAKMEAERGDTLLATRAMYTADRDRPGYYLAIIEFNSYEEAMENSNHPATAEMAKNMAALADGPPRFYNLDLIQVMKS
jgi:hypothetical protein